MERLELLLECGRERIIPPILDRLVRCFWMLYRELICSSNPVSLTASSGEGWTGGDREIVWTISFFIALHGATVIILIERNLLLNIFNH